MTSFSTQVSSSEVRESLPYFCFSSGASMWERVDFVCGVPVHKVKLSPSRTSVTMPETSAA